MTVMTPERLEWLKTIAASGKKRVGIAFFSEALSALEAELLRPRCSCKYHSAGCPVFLDGAFFTSPTQKPNDGGRDG